MLLVLINTVTRDIRVIRIIRVMWYKSCWFIMITRVLSVIGVISVNGSLETALHLFRSITRSTQLV